MKKSTITKMRHFTKLLIFTVLLTFSACLGRVEGANRIDSLYNCIDEAIANTQVYVANRENSIQQIRNLFNTSTSAMARYSLAIQLYGEYKAYMTDSALVWLDRAESIAMQEEDRAGEAHCKALRAYQCSTAGYYTEAVDVLSNTDKRMLSSDALVDYYKALNHVYNELAYYCRVDELKQQYQAKSNLYGDSLIAVADANADIRLQLLETRSYAEGDYEAALRYNDMRLKNAPEGSHALAIVAYYRYLDYKMIGNDEEWNYWLATSALNDVRNAVMDQAALWELANAIQYTDIDRSYRYINFSQDCASNFTTRLRNQQIAPVMQVVDNMYQKQNQRKNNYLKVVIVVSVGCLLIVLAFLFYGVRQRRRLALTQAELSQKNTQLTALNAEMKQMLDNLDMVNKRLLATGDSLNEAVVGLNESNRVKEKYIGLFLRQCSTYIDRMDTMRRDFSALVKAKRYADLAELLKNRNFRDQEREELFEIFDSSFIRLFPTFVDEFNMLLKPENRILLTDPSKLTTGIRIFALIRLGIDESSKIAEFLHFSVNTIYNYRAKIKDGAIVNRDEFEDCVRAIGHSQRN